MKTSELEQTFITRWLQLAPDLPMYEREYRGLKPRQFRFDFAWPDIKLVVECIGGVWTKGRHSRGKGQTDDFIRHNIATLAGWRILYVTAGMLEDDPAGFIDQVRALLETSAADSKEPGVTVRVA